ncbi:MAG TPA: right-handed parallel beta-helix repeat-containing protein [Tepidisphaeraceae bacterium]|nr:right-handed parallel beta-helix repeat-containing protein [Tepidisphaeraceae bacterium]
MDQIFVANRRGKRRIKLEAWLTMKRNSPWRGVSMVLSLCVFATLRNQPTALAADWYVAPTGLDANNGSLNTPFATITKAVTTAAAGDTIFLRGGTYNVASTITITKSGTASLPLTLQNYANETPVLSYGAQAVGSSSRGIVLRGDHWRMKGFTIQYAGDNGLLVAGSNNVIDRLVARQNNDSGFAIQSVNNSRPSNNLIINSDSYGNYDNQGTSYGENADGFAVKFRGLGTGNVLRGNRAWNNSDDGYDFWQAESGVTVENCWAFHNGRSSLFQGIGTFNGDGNGFKLGHDSGTHVLANTITWGHPTHGIDVNGNATQLEGTPPLIAHGVQIYNNTGFNNAGDDFYFDENPTTATPATSHVLRNNVSIRVSGNSLLSNVTVIAGNTADHNTWNGVPLAASSFHSLLDPLTAQGIYNPATDRTGATTAVHATGPATGPRQADGSLPVLPFLRPKWGTNLVNSGTNVGYSFAYGAPDLGAYEAAFPGDTNWDGQVNLDDFTALAAGFGNPSNIASGDFDFDGVTTLNDFTILASNFGLSVPAPLLRSALPEPVLAPGVMIAVALLQRRGR